MAAGASRSRREIEGIDRGYGAEMTKDAELWMISSGPVPSVVQTVEDWSGVMARVPNVRLPSTFAPKRPRPA
jgi:hypothetical protein